MLAQAKRFLKIQNKNKDKPLLRNALANARSSEDFAIYYVAMYLYRGKFIKLDNLTDLQKKGRLRAYHCVKRMLAGGDIETEVYIPRRRDIADVTAIQRKLVVDWNVGGENHLSYEELR